MKTKRTTSRNYWKMIPLMLIILTACDSSDTEIDELIDDKIEQTVGVNLDVESILKMINDHRAAGAVCGSSNKESVPALKWSNELAKAALDHSNDMQVNNYFNHTSQDGRNFSKRAKDAGFTGSPIGENIANGYRTEELVMNGWMESSGHCKNIMKNKATHVGVARSNEGSYWTMVLGQIN